MKAPYVENSRIYFLRNIGDDRTVAGLFPNTLTNLYEATFFKTELGELWKFINSNWSETQNKNYIPLIQL
jgi:hypothetical protein